MTTWTYEQAEPTSTYLVTLQIGMYEQAPAWPRTASRCYRGAARPTCERNFDHDFGRQPQMMKLFVKLFGPYPLSTGYTVVVTDDDLEIPLEAQGISIFGANHCDGQRGVGAADRPRTGAPVVRQLGDRQTMAATSGCTRASPATPNGCGRRTPAATPPTSGRATTTSGCPIRRRICCCPTRARATCSTTGCTNAAR